MPALVAPQHVDKRMTLWQEDHVRVVADEQRSPVVRAVIDGEVIAKDLRPVDLDPSIDKDPAAAWVQPPEQVAAVVVIVENAKAGPEPKALNRVGRLYREGRRDRRRLVRGLHAREGAVGDHPRANHEQDGNVDEP